MKRHHSIDEGREPGSSNMMLVKRCRQNFEEAGQSSERLNRPAGEPPPPPPAEEIMENPILSYMNPIMMPCILEMILGYLPLQNLKSCRGVCKLWKEEISRYMKKLKIVKIVEDDYSETSELWVKGRKRLLSQLHVKQSCTSNDMFEKLLIFKGYFLDQLTLEKCHLNVHSFTNLMATDAFPYLTHLVLRQNEYVVNVEGSFTIFVPDVTEEPPFKSLKVLEIDERGSEFETRLEDIAKMCPNLQRLTYSNCPTPRRVTDPQVNLSNLEFLQLAPRDGTRMDHQYFETLVDLKLKNLKQLFLYGLTPGGAKRMQSLQKFLKSVSKMLSSLHLGQRIMYDPEYQRKSKSPFPVSMPNLRRISVGPGFVHSLKLLDKLPSVTSFTCNRMVASDWDLILKKGLPKQTTTIGSLDLGDVGESALQKFAFAFPFLSRLEINVSRVGDHDAILRAICGGFPQLQMFNIYDVSNRNLLTDSGVTGIPTESLEEAANALSSCDKSSFVPNRSFPYIGNLKNLIDLRLQYLSGRLTDVSIFYGVKDVPNVFALDISKSLVTDATLSTLAEHAANLSVLYLRDCINITTDGISKFRAIRPAVQVRL